MDSNQFETLKTGDRVATNSMALANPNRWGEIQAVSSYYISLLVDGETEPILYSPIDLAALDGDPVNTAEQSARIRNELATCERLYLSRFGTIRLDMGRGNGLICYYLGKTGQATFPRRSAEYAAWQQIDTARRGDDWRLVDIHDDWGDVYERRGS